MNILGIELYRTTEIQVPTTFIEDGWHGCYRCRTFVRLKEKGETLSTIVIKRSNRCFCEIDINDYLLDRARNAGIIEYKSENGWCLKEV
jgi:hypothetical protein